MEINDTDFDFVFHCAEPDGPPMDVVLQPVTSQSIRVTWKASLYNMYLASLIVLLL